MEAVDEATTAPATTVEHALRPALAAAEDEPVEIDEAVWAACADDPTLFTRPAPPLSTTVDAAGLARDGEWLAPAGFDFARWRTGRRLAGLADRHGLEDDEALAVLVTVLLYERVADLVEAARTAEHDLDPAALADLAAHLAVPADQPAERGTAAGADTRGTARQALEWLAEPVVAEAVLTETTGTDRRGAAALGLFAETLEPMAPRSARPALRWLRGKAWELLGQTAEAEAAFQAAETADPAWPLALVELAHYASDRGDAARSLTLLRRAGVADDDPLMAMLAQFEMTPRSDLGRNHPCWCGSGRKYKQCHLGRERAPLGERSGWLYEKAAQFVVNGPGWGVMQAVAQERARYAESPEQVMAAIHDPLVLDAVLFEGGAFAEFLATRGVLLPEDERMLAEQWLLADRSVYDIQQVRSGTGMTVRDVRTGDVHDVVERTASRQLAAGDLICARIVPAGDDTRHIFGGAEPVALHHRDDLIALLDDQPDPIELVAVLTRRFAPAALYTTEGEPLVLCEATLRAPDPAGLQQMLDQTYDRTQADEPEWAEHVTTNAMPHIRAILRLDGDDLHVQANSEPRLDRVLATLRDAHPAITLVAQSRHPARDLREAQHLAKRLPARADQSQPLDPQDPELAVALDQFVLEYERRWLDEPIPALAGRTPRQCAADPTRRPDLIRLLDSFPDGRDNPGAMRPDRLRTALGLV